MVGLRAAIPGVKAFQNPAQLALARKLYAEQQTPVADLCRMFKVSPATFYRYAGTAAAGDTKDDTKR